MYTHKYTQVDTYTQTSNAVYNKSSIVFDISLASITMATVNKRKENKANKSTDKSIIVNELGFLKQSICHRSYVLKSSAIVLC